MNNEISSSKRMRVDAGALMVLNDDDQQQEPRSSSLPSSTLQLTGHSGSVYALEYSPDGSALLSASFDKSIFLWNHQDGYENYNVLNGHKNAVLDAKWMDDETVVSCGADKTVMLWDATTGQRLRQWKDATGIVNSCCSLSDYLLASVSDDGTCYLMDRRSKRTVAQYESDFPVLAVAGTSEQVFCAGIDSKITCWNLHMQKKVYAMTGHTDTVTSLSLHPEGTHILSNSMDRTCKSWDIRPFVGNTQKQRRQVKEFVGHVHAAEKGLLKCAWSGGHGQLVSAGSADHMVHIWDEFTAQELYLLPGHKGCVNAVAFHPTEVNVVASGGSDKQIFVGELAS